MSARTGDGVEALVSAIIERMPEGPQYYPDGMITDAGDGFWVSELVREELLKVVREEMPHSIACRVTEWEWPRIRCEILVERESQKGIVIGRGGLVLKQVGPGGAGPARPGRLPGAGGQGRQGLAAPPRGPRPPGLLSGGVYRWCMSRTNIDLDDEACRAVMERYRLATKRDAGRTSPCGPLAAEPLGLDAARRLRGSGLGR